MHIEFPTADLPAVP